MFRPALLLLLALLFAPALPAAEIERIWLTHAQADASTLVINWETEKPGPSLVEYGLSPETLLQRVAKEEKVTLHHVEIPLGEARERWYYRVSSGSDASAIYSFRGYAADELRVAVVADTGYAKAAWAPAVLASQPHLLLSAGDHVPALHQGQPVPLETTAAFSRLVASSPELFRSVPWMPLLGNHDREIRPRGPKPPPDPVYDVEATAFRRFFALPEPEWHWHLDLPAFGVRFIAADLSHLSDMGTTWQTCHPYTQEGEQFQWYSRLVGESAQPYLITLYNERHSQVRSLEKGAWARLIEQGTLAITGFGYFGERAETDGFSYYNTSVSGTGAKYPDPKSAFIASEDNFLLLTFRRAPLALRVELRSLSGAVLETRDFTPRKATGSRRKP